MTYCSYNVYQVLSLDPNLSVLKQLVDLAGLKSAVSALKNSTLFAPTNSSFVKEEKLWYIFN